MDFQIASKKKTETETGRKQETKNSAKEIWNLIICVFGSGYYVHIKVAVSGQIVMKSHDI